MNDVVAGARAIESPSDDETVMAFVDAGPELVVRTSLSVLSMPNHRPQPGFMSTWDAMTTTRTDVARTILDREGVDLVVVCDAASRRAFYGDGADTLHTRLATGDAPSWLDEVGTYGGDGSATIRWYRVAAG